MNAGLNMTTEKYEQINFDTWQELAKYVIDGGEVYYGHIKIKFEDSQFNVHFEDELMSNLYIKKQPTLEELIAIKPRLCWVWDDSDDQRKSVSSIIGFDGKHYRSQRCWWLNAQMLTDDEIKQFLSDGHHSKIFLSDGE